MPDNNIEIVRNDSLPIEATTNSKVTQYLPIAVGAGIGIIAGAAIYKFIIEPAITKHRAKKTNEANKTNES
jgi:hypothetical protein